MKPTELVKTLAATQAAMDRRPAAYPQVLVTSANVGDGLPELRAAIARLLRERR